MDRVKEIFIDESKSMANRLLILASFTGRLLPVFGTQAKDVVELRQSLVQFLAGKTEFFVGEGGTTFRFLLARVSRKPGRYTVHANERLLSRPHQPLYDGLNQLGVKVHVFGDRVEIAGEGWMRPERPLRVDCSLSTQFASALLLSSKDLPFTLEWDLRELGKSLPYWRMTQKLVDASVLPPCELDVSSAFSVAAYAAVGKGAVIKDFPFESSQADAVFVDLFQRMGIGMRKDRDLTILSSKCGPVEADLENSPDLLPVLSALCALAEGASVLKNADHVRHKESDRMEKSIELIVKAGGGAYEKNGDLYIEGPLRPVSSFAFDPDRDHRMAMAAAVLRRAGVKVEILNSHVVNKSFPGFWRVVEDL